MMTVYPARLLGMIALVVFLAACGGRTLAPVVRPLEEPPGSGTPRRVSTLKSHTVQKGESVYAIAWAYGLDYRQIAVWNQIVEPYTIFPGQRLQLHPPAPRARRKKSESKPVTKPITKPVKKPGTKSTKSKSKSKSKTKPKTKPKTKSLVKTTRPAKAVPASPRRAPKAPVEKKSRYTGAVVKTWRWPAKGKLIGRFNKGGGKGINIQGRRGQPVYTAAAGRVVYSGSGLRGYGKLIIIKHNKRFLSAYAHNQRLQVREGDIVKGGQQIAQMGNTESREVKLHFEIRRDGKPVNPIQYLP